MVGLLILKHLLNLLDESVVEQWGENIYYQYLCGGQEFVPGVPCEASELVHFRHRIGAEGCELIFKESIRINGDDSNEGDVIADTTVQEKNITYPTDAKVHRKIIDRCKKIANKEGVVLCQSYTRTLKELALSQRFRSHPRNKKKAFRVDRKVKTIAWRLVRELERKRPSVSLYRLELPLFNQVLRQQKTDSHKIYSLHEPQVECISKGKEHKKYEFGNKVSVLYTQTTGVIVGACSFRNPYDGHTLPEALKQRERLVKGQAKTATCDRGYKGRSEIKETKIQIPKPFNDKKQSKYLQRKLRNTFRRRAAIESTSVI
jgi:IS5 family transposase